MFLLLLFRLSLCLFVGQFACSPCVLAFFLFFLCIFYSLFLVVVLFLYFVFFSSFVIFSSLSFDMNLCATMLH